jgi:hypothetical protein
LDPNLLAQTERNLRRQLFLKSAVVRRSPPRGNEVDMEVVTQDTWTTEPRLALGRSGGVNTFGVSVVERNLLGTGRKVKFAYDDGVERIRRFFELIDPHLLGAYGEGTFLYGFNSDGDEGFFSVARPFAGTIDRSTARLTYADGTRRERIYRAGTSVSEFRQDYRTFSAEYGRAWIATPISAFRMAGGLSYSRDRFQAEAGDLSPIVPPDREFAYVYLRVELLESRLVKLDYVNHDSRFEDFNVGPRVNARLGLSPEAFGLDRTTGMVEIEASDGRQLGQGAIVQGWVSFGSRLGADRRNALLTGEVRAVQRFGPPFLQTLVGRVQALRGWDLDPDRQFFADADAGLRGYELYTDEGDKRILFNLEHRLFLGRELFQILAPGAAVFLDAGAAAPAGRPLRAKNVRADVGIGLRLGLPRAASHDLIRIDVAYPLSDDVNGERNLLVSISGEQAF